MLDRLNSAVRRVYDMPRVQFPAEAHVQCHRWIDRFHENGELPEPTTMAALAVFGQGKKTFYDVGALYGYYSLWVRGLFPEAAVIAFEMHPTLFGRLLGCVDSKVKCVHAAVTSKTLPERQRAWVNAYNLFEIKDKELPPEAFKSRGAEMVGPAEISFISLDDFANSEGAAPEVVKIDVEAYQTEALRGFRKTMRKNGPSVVVELHDPEKTARMGTSNRETIEMMLNGNYRCFWADNRRSGESRFVEIGAPGDEQEVVSIAAFSREAA